MAEEARPVGILVDGQPAALVRRHWVDAREEDGSQVRVEIRGRALADGLVVGHLQVEVSRLGELKEVQWVAVLVARGRHRRVLGQDVQAQAAHPMASE